MIAGISVFLNINGELKEFSSNTESVERLPVVPQNYILGIITQDLTTPMERARDVQACPLQDHSTGTGKGHTYIVHWSWFEFMQKVQSQKAYEWWKKPFMLMVNRRHRYDGLLPYNGDECRFENICLPCNYIAFDKLTATHGRVVGRMNTFLDTNTLDPTKNNWKKEPYLFWKATMHDLEGNVWRVGSALDVFTPVIRQLSEQWCNLRRIELFQSLPFNVFYEGKVETITGYCFKNGTDVYGHAETIDVPLRLCYDNGDIVHPTSWKLKEKSVPV